MRTRAVALNNADLAAGGEVHIAGYEFSGEVAAVGPGDSVLVTVVVMNDAGPADPVLDVAVREAKSLASGALAGVRQQLISTPWLPAR